MGDRANVRCVDWSGGVFYLYTHWGGTDLPLTVQSALLRKECWDDPSYLARIIFDEMTGLDGETRGHGISANMGDNEHNLIEIDANNQTVTFYECD